MATLSDVLSAAGADPDIYVDYIEGIYDDEHTSSPEKVELLRGILSSLEVFIA